MYIYIHLHIVLLPIWEAWLANRMEEKTTAAAATKAQSSIRTLLSAKYYKILWHRSHSTPYRTTEKKEEKPRRR